MIPIRTVFFINKNHDTNSRLARGRVDVDRSFEKSCNYPPSSLSCSLGAEVQGERAATASSRNHVCVPAYTHARTHTRPVPAPPPPWWCCNPTTIAAAATPTAGRDDLLLPSLGDLFTTS